MELRGEGDSLLSTRRSLPTPMSPAHEDEDHVAEDLDVGVDIYNAVVVAAFGGITQRLSKREQLYVHPAVIFLGCVLLVTVQLSAIVYLRLDMDLDVPVWTNSTYRRAGYEGVTHHDLWEQVPYEDRPSRAKILMALKILMVFVVQMVQFDRLAKSLRMLIFLMNPVTWMDMARPQLDKDIRFKCFYSQYVLSPFSIAAKLLQLVVDYVICVDAVSIILASEDCKDVIYDALAITFIADLGTACWAVTRTVIHIDDFQEFKFQLANSEDRRRREHDSCLPGWLVRWLVTFLSHRRGGYARKMEIFATFLIAGWVLYRQALVVLFALETDILPVARDVCTLFRWGEHEANHMFVTSWIWRMMAAHVVVRDPTEAIRHIADPDEGGYCTDKYDRMHLSDEFRVLINNPWLLLIFLFLVLPQAFVLFNRELRQYICYNGAAVVVEDKEEPDADEGKVDGLTAEIQQLRHQVTMLKDARDENHSSSARQRAEANYEVEELRSQVESMRRQQQESNDAIEDLRARLESMSESMERARAVPKSGCGWSRGGA